MPRPKNKHTTKVFSVRIRSEYFEKLKMLVNEFISQLNIENHKYHKKGANK